MADQWGRKIWLAIKELTGAPISSSSAQQLVEANYDRRDENGVEVPGVPDGDGNIPQPPVDTSFLQKTFDIAELANLNAGISIGGNLKLQPRTAFGYSSPLSGGVVDERTLWAELTEYAGHKIIIPNKASVRSTSSKDTLLGTGARTIQIYGFSSLSSGVIQNEIVEMTGGAEAFTSKDFVRVTGAVIRSWGSDANNVGSLDVTIDNNQNAVYCYIPSNRGINHRAGFYIPPGKSVLITRVAVIAQEESVTGIFTINLRSPVGKITIETILTGGGRERNSAFIGILVKGGIDMGTDLDLQKTLISGTSRCSATINYVEIDDSLIDYANMSTDTYYDLNTNLQY